MNQDYIRKSLELHLFFGRIMKEHSLFLTAGFTPVSAAFSRQSEFYKREFEKLLSRAVALGNGVVGRAVVQSGELVTEFTLPAEKQTEQFTGIAIDTEITIREQQLLSAERQPNENPMLYSQVQNLNRTALPLLNGLIQLKESILANVLSCKMFTMNYPLLLEHIIREAKLYRAYVRMLEQEGDITGESMKEIECFWNRIMMEHAMFIRGLLDPAETGLFDTANGFADEYAALLTTCNNAQAQTMTAASLAETVRFRDFKAAGVAGIEQCKIRSVILPLLADHVLREANHYIRILKN